MRIQIIHISVQGKSIGNIKIMRRLKDYIEIIWQKQEKNPEIIGPRPVSFLLLIGWITWIPYIISVWAC
jgi:hypothetical protein